MKEFNRIICVMLAVLMLAGVPVSSMSYGMAVTVNATALNLDTGIPGDINGDGRVNSRDLLALAKNLAKWSDPVNNKALDTDGNGKINSRDLLNLAKFLAKWDVTLYYDSDVPTGLTFALSADETYYAVTGIGSCTDTQVVIPNKYKGLPVKEVASGAFANCQNITRITLPENITKIGSNAFGGCCMLEQIVLPESVSAVGDSAFAGCSPLLRVYYTGDPEGWQNLYSSMSSGNKDTLSADVFYYSTAEPTDDSYTYWHYNGDTPELYYIYDWIVDNEWEYLYALLEKDSYRRTVNGIMAGIENLETEIRVYTEIPRNQLGDFCQIILPMLSVEDCYINSNGFTCSYSYQSNDPNTTLIIKPTYYVSSKSEAQQMMTELKTKADEILALMPTGLSEYEKVLYIHDWIVQNSTPDVNSYEGGNGGEWADNAYGVIIDGEPVCLGYSKALHYMLKKVGVECFFELGVAGGVGHIWSKVRCDGKWYNIDSIWDDPCGQFQNEDPDYISYDYFMLTDEMLAPERNEIFDNIFMSVPVCDTTKYNWYIYNNLVFDTAAQVNQSAREQLLACGEAGDEIAYVRFKFTTEEAYNDYYTNIQANINNIFVGFSSPYGGGIWLSMSDSNLSMTFKVTKTVARGVPTFAVVENILAH